MKNSIIIRVIKFIFIYDLGHVLDPNDVTTLTNQIR